MNNRKTHKRMGSRLLAILCATLLVATMLPISVAADSGDLYDGWYALTDGITMDASSGAITLDGMSAAQHLYLNHENGSAENASRFSKDSMTDFVIEFDFFVTDYTNKADVDAGNAGAGNGALSLALMGLDGSRLDYECVTARVDYANAGIMWRGYSAINNPYEGSWGYASGISQWHWILNYADAKHAKITKSGNTITLDINNGYIVQTATLPSDIGLPAAGYVGLLVEGAKVTVANMVVSTGAEKESFFNGNVTGDVYQGWWYAPLTGADNAVLNADNSLTINAMNGTEALFLNHDGGNNTALFGKDTLTDFVIEFDFTVLDYVNKALVEDGTGANLGAGNGALSLSMMALSGDYLHYEAVTARMDYQNAGIMWRGYSAIANPYEGSWGYASGISQWHWLFNNGDARHAKITKSGNTITLDVANGYVVQSATLPADIGLPAAGYVGFLLENVSVNFRNVKVTNTATGASQEFFHVHAWNTPTCTQPWTCSTCGTQTGEAAGHSFADGICGVCGEADPDYNACAHEYFYACDKVCMLCYELTNPDATHTMVHVPALAPTCTEIGNIEYWYCADCGGAWDNADATGMPLNQMSVKLPASHTYTDACDEYCDACDEWRAAPHNLTYVEGVVPANCQETGHDEYWKCETCNAYFGDAEASWQVNPGWIYYTGEHVRPEGSIPCAVVPCELCGEDSYGEACDRGDAPVCQDAPCINCGEICWGWGCNYNTGDEEIPAPLCQPGDCVYCGKHYDKLYDCENGSWAPCSYDGECAYGCGKQYPATGIHEVDNPCEGGLCWLCWEEIAPTHTYVDGECSCGAKDPNAAVVVETKTIGTATYTVMQRADGTYKLVISGTGAVKALTTEYAYDEVIIEEGITEIASKAFSGNAALKNITFPESLEAIGSKAFMNSGLVSVTLADDVVLGQEVFYGCASLEEAYIGNIKALDGNGVKRSWIPTASFRNCTALTFVSFGDGLNTIQNAAFKNTGLEYVYIPGNIKIVSNTAFDSCANLTTVEIEEGVKTLAFRVFAGCKKLTNVTVPSSVTTLGAGVFRSCYGLENAVLNSTVAVTDETFFDNRVLTSVTLAEGTPSINWRSFFKCTKLESIVIPESVTAIGELVFYNCLSLTEIVIPANVKTIGEKAFENCKALATVYVDSAVVAAGLTSDKAMGYLTRYATTVAFAEGIEAPAYIAENFPNVEVVDGYTVYSK